jgi:tRNA pseudouridine38-40 synthase
VAVSEPSTGMQLRLVVQYDGTAFEGWQLQPSGPTVQGELERALAVALREPVRVRGAGRTDAGVHAAGQVAAAHVARLPADLGRLRTSLNAILPETIVVTDIEPVADAFDPRRDARRRRYAYRIWRAPAPSPFWRRYAWHLWGPLDVGGMEAAAAAVIGEHDFGAFCASDAEPVRSTVRHVYASRFEVCDALLVYRIEANAFLKHMVRTLIGTFVEIGRGQRPVASVRDLLAVGDRRQAGATAPAHGLVLERVLYDGDESSRA